MNTLSRSGTPIHPRIGERVMLARRAQALTQHELADRAQTSPTVMNRVENGQQSVSAERLAAIAEVLGVSLDARCQRGDEPVGPR